MRNDYAVENQHSLAWGFDHTGGFFLQVFDERNPEEDIMILDADQGDALTNFSISSGRLTYDTMIHTLTQYSEKALQDFYVHMNKRFDDILFGYAYDENGKYREKVVIKNNKELFQFIDSIQNAYTITDGWDVFIDLRTLKEFVAA